jgi:preprotein translocase subunit SecG
VEGQDQRRVLGDHQRFGRDLHALSRIVRFRPQVPGVEHHAIADHAELAAPHHAGGQRVQLVDLPSITSVWPALCPPWKRADHVGAFAQPVDDLALALVAPLGADDHDIGHICLIGVVLLQRSEGGGLGMGGGGGVMTGRQAATALGKLTWAFAIAFLATSITLTIIAAQNSAGESVLDRIGVETAPEDGGDGGLLPPAASDLLPPVSGDAPALPPRADE